VSEAACEPPASRAGSVRALLIGVDQSTSDVYGELVGQLRGPKNDVELLAEVLRTRGVPETDVVVLQGDGATFDRVKGAFDRLAAETGYGDFLFIHFSGFLVRTVDVDEAPETAGGAVHMVLADSVTEFGEEWDQASIFASAERTLRLEDVAAGLDRALARGGSVLVSIDAGVAARFDLSYLVEADATETAWTWNRVHDREPMPTNAAQRSRSEICAPERGGLTVFYAADETSNAHETQLSGGAAGEAPHVFGLFSFALANALHDGLPVTARQLAHRVEDRFRGEELLGLMSVAVYRAPGPDERLFGPLGEGCSRIRTGTRDPVDVSITVAEHELNESTRGAKRDRKVWLQGSVGETAGLASLMVKGNPVPFSADGSFSAHVDLLPGENIVNVAMVFSEPFHIQTRKVMVEVGEGVVDLKAVGTSYALVIGIADYEAGAWDDLRTPLADADAVASVLAEDYDFEIQLRTGPDGEVPLLLHNPTRAEITDTLALLQRHLREDDSLLIYFAGHGEYLEKIDTAYWIPADGSDVNQTTWISSDEINNSVHLMDARHVLLVSDSCYSGGMGGRSKDTSASSEDGQIKDKALENYFGTPSRVLFASGGYEKVKDRGGDGHSVFSRAFLTGLNEIEEPAFTASYFYNEWVREQVAGRARQKPWSDVLNNSGHQGGDFVFFKTVETREERDD